MSRNVNRGRIPLVVVGLVIVILVSVITYRTLAITSRQITVPSKITYPIAVYPVT